MVHFVKSGSTLVSPIEAQRDDGRSPRFVWPYSDSAKDMFRARCDSLQCQLRRPFPGEKVVPGTMWIEELNGEMMSKRPRIKLSDLGKKNPPPTDMPRVRALFDAEKLLSIELDGDMLHYDDADESFLIAKWIVNMRLMEHLFMDNHLRIHSMFEDLQYQLDLVVNNPHATFLRRACMSYAHSTSFINGLNVPPGFKSAEAVGAIGSLWHPSMDVFRVFPTPKTEGPLWDSPIVPDSATNPESCNLQLICELYAHEWILHDAEEISHDCVTDELARKMMNLTGIKLSTVAPGLSVTTLSATCELVLCCHLLNCVHGILHNHLDASQHSVDTWCFDSYPDRVPKLIRANHYGFTPTEPTRVVPKAFRVKMKALAKERGSRTFALWSPETMSPEVDR